ncbi:aminopeptidase P family protein [Blastomonas sp.]|uniref:aminopeptidase P family protein n=1 Tax=Blastomonas sp. TaxID=1909299 RepID=UPI002634FC80|nr:aminopeptidase P family protein [Blastomonas sp.]MDM7954922.1 aminopeptidase P family protein [Blastomonas sp.]
MSTHEARLAELRKELKRQGLHGFVVPICDEHMSEYIGGYAQRLEWLTGFGGSAGTAVVLADKAAIFIDGRYTIQVRDQVDGRLYDYVGTAQQSVADWLGQNAPEGGRIGYDAWLHTRDWVKQATARLAKRGAELVEVGSNPVDAVWHDQPERPTATMNPHPTEYAGRDSADKRTDIARWLGEEGLDAAVITALDSVAWVFNVRGADISHTPVALSYGVVRKDGTADLYVAPEKVSDDLRAHLGNQVALHDYAAFEAGLDALAGKSVAVDPERAVAAIFSRLEGAGAKIVARRDPSVLPRATKNATEISGQRAAQSRDGAAVSQFLHWLSIAGPAGGETELSAAAKLLTFREQTGLLVDTSFDTISGASSNGAICHYRVSEETNLPIVMDSLYLVDSGGQYLDGTTDITRTIAIGTPTAEMKRRFTQVLKGHIALATIRFPHGTTGGQLDVLARQYLWAEGVDYAHGTGHGVGSFLSVHEGPQRIAAFGGMSEPLRPGMICSNEPGYYKAGEFGIRIENLVLVEEIDIPGAEQPMLGFETLTFAPIDRNAIEPDLLSTHEREWLNRYHAKVWDIVAPQVAGDALEWLERACAPIG